MKKTFTLFSSFVLAGCLMAPVAGFSQEMRRCGTLENEAFLRSQDPFYDQKKEDMERQLQTIIANMQAERISTGQSPFAQYSIPIVYHVVYQNATENVSDAKVLAMHAQLNMDFARTNTDAGNTPSYFASSAVDMQIQFCLATKDNNNNPTNGIVHKSTTVGSFSTNNAVKSTASGGDDAWNVQKYFNVWICDLGSSLLGYGQFPPPSSNYGVVIHYITVGSLTMHNTSGGQFGYGRTLSHEIGHCFNLIHIWGDESGCSGTDQCADTPNQADATSGCPSGVKTDNCTGAPNGVEYQNYMDYTDDLCYNMFSNDQKTRAQAAVFQYLTNVANSAASVCGSTAVTENSLSENISLFPNPSTGDVYISTVLANINSMDLKIYNAIGETVMNKKITITSSGETKINLGGKADGIYLFEVKTSEGTITKKVVINR